MTTCYLQSQLGYCPNRFCTCDHEYLEPTEEEDSEAFAPPNLMSHAVPSPSTSLAVARVPPVFLPFPVFLPLPAIPTNAQPPGPSTTPKKKKSKGRHKKDYGSAQRVWIAPKSTTPLKDFFRFYKNKGFVYDSTRAATDEFYRLCDQQGWPSRNPPPERTKACKDFRAALVYQFGVCFGTDLQDLRAWKQLCKAIGFDEIPSTVPQCRQMVEGVYVNIVDLVDKMKSQKCKARFTVQRFASARELAQYSRNTGKLFPPYNGGGILSFLMRHLNHPRPIASNSQPIPSATPVVPADMGDDDLDDLNGYMEGLAVS